MTQIQAIDPCSKRKMKPLHFFEKIMGLRNARFIYCENEETFICEISISANYTPVLIS
jgi:hypothetical protein